MLYIYLIQSNTCRGEFSNFVKDVLWYFVFIFLLHSQYLPFYKLCIVDTNTSSLFSVCLYWIRLWVMKKLKYMG